MAGQATELFNLASSFDPYGAFRQGQMAPQKYDIQQAMLDEQTKELEADKAAELGQQAAQPGQPVALAKMANQMIPDAKLYNDDGTLTTAGQMNDMLMNATKLAKQGKMMGMQASLIEDPYQRTQAIAEARRLTQTAQQDQIKARELNDKVKSDSIYAAAMSKDQMGWDAALQAYQDSGLPLPKGVPTEYSPDNAKKIAALAPAALQSKIRNDQLKEAEDARRTKREERAVVAAEAKARNGDGGGGGETKITAEIDKRLNQSEVGLKTANQIETILSNSKAAKALDNSQFLRSLLETPKELGSVEKYIKSNVYQSLPKESQDLVTLIVKMRNDYYRQTSGQAVTGGEAARNFFAVVQPSDNTQTILNKIKNQKGQYVDALEAGIDDYKMPTSRKNRLRSLVEEGKKGGASEAGGGASADAMRAQAQAAIAAGAPKDAVAKMYKEKTGKDF
jgi:hypothetical protein